MRARLMAIALATVAGLTMFSSTGASAQTVQFFAVLAGGNETAAADPDGQGVASVMLGGSGQICYSLLVRGIANPTAAHIHEAKAGASGPIRITLTPVPASGALGASSGCLNGQSAAVLARLKATPSNFYINVHTGAFVNGAVRGQLF